MIVRYYNPFADVDFLKRQLDNLFDGLGEPDKVVQTTWTPAISLVDAGDRYRLQVQLPAVNKDAIDIQASRKSVAISGERKAPDWGEAQPVLVNEFRYGTFRRVVNLPTAIDQAQVEADYTDGILTLQLPKVTGVPNSIVKVSINGATAAAAEAKPEVTEVSADTSVAS